MPRSRIRQDSHGLFVSTLGHVYRPSTKSRYAAGDTEYVQRGDNPKVAAVGDELWRNHGVNFSLIYADGAYQSTRFRNSEEAFNPKYIEEPPDVN